MTAVQKHGGDYENKVILERTGITKDEYEKLLKSGYTSEFDLEKGVKVDYNASIKASKTTNVNCSDLLRKMRHKEYRFIVGLWEQVTPEEKLFHTQYEFFITEKDYPTLWGNLEYEEVEEFVNFVKAIPAGRDGQKGTLSERNILQEELEKKGSLFKINPKVDSKKQRRVQCTLPIDKLVSAGVKYMKTDLNFLVTSTERKFK